MRFQSAVFAFAASLALVSAQDLSAFPACSLPCLVAAIPGSGCTTSDVKCQCTTGQAKIAASLNTCIPTKCPSPADQQKLIDASAKACSSAGVPLASTAVVSGATPASSAAASAASSAAASAASSAAAAASSAAASAASSASAAISSAAASAASKTGSAPAQTSNAAAGNFAGMGAVAFGVAAVLGL